MNMKFDERDLQKLMKKFDGLSKGEMTKFVKPAVEVGVKKIGQAAKRNAKVNVKGLTISKMVTYKTWSRAGSVFGRVMAQTKKIGDRTVKIDGREVPFEVVANILEYGSSTRNIKARHFMKRAYEVEGKKAKDQILRQLINKINVLGKTGKV